MRVIQCQCFDKRRVFFTGKSQRLFKIRVVFRPEISALAVFLNFDNERMYSLKYQSDPPGVCDISYCMIRVIEEDQNDDFSDTVKFEI